jgi:hypothetical protein
MEPFAPVPVIQPAAPAFKDRRGWLVAFGVVEILIACFFLLMVVFMTIVMPSMPMPPGQPELPKGIFAIAGFIFYAPLAAIWLTVGIGSIRARNWARIAMIALSSIWLVFGVLGTLSVAFLMPMILRHQQAAMQQKGAALPENFSHIMTIVVVTTQIVMMIMVPLILLLFYANKNVKATCLAAAASRSGVQRFEPAAIAGPPVPTVPSLTLPVPPSVNRPATRQVPVPVIILAIWSAFSALSALLTAAMIPMAIICGTIVHGFGARLIMLTFGAVSAYCVWGLFKLRREGWWATLIFLGFGTLSGIVTVFRLDMHAYMDEIYRTMGISPPPFDIFKISPGFMTFTMGLGMLLAAGIFVLLLYSKRYFQNRQP